MPCGRPGALLLPFWLAIVQPATSFASCAGMRCTLNSSSFLSVSNAALVPGSLRSTSGRQLKQGHSSLLSKQTYHYRPVTSVLSSDKSSMYRYQSPIVVPDTPSANQSITASVIMLHGLGDTGHGWADIAGQFAAALPHVRFIFPHAPERPITLNMGFRMPGWYDIYSLDSINRKEDKEGLAESARYIAELISNEEEKGVKADRIVVAGFSQGGAIALYMLRGAPKLAGVVGLSTYVPLHDDPGVLDDANKATPVFLAHGDADQVVRYEYGTMSFELLKKLGANVQFKTYHGMQHSACPQELSDLAQFLQKVLPPTHG